MAIALSGAMYAQNNTIHVLAYVGPDNKPELKPLYANLNKRGVMCMISTARLHTTSWHPRKNAPMPTAPLSATVQA